MSHLKRGISMVEVILATAILVGLATIVFVALQPQEAIRGALTAKEAQDVKEMNKAAQLYMQDEGELPVAEAGGALFADGTKDICKDGIDPADAAAHDVDCVSMDAVVSYGLLERIPIADAYQTDAYISGYEVHVKGTYVEICKRGQCPGSSYSGGGTGGTSPGSSSSAGATSSTSSSASSFPSNLVAYWNLEENAGTTAVDLIHGNNASILGTTSWTTDTPSGLPGSSTAVDLSAGYLSAPSATVFDFADTDAFSVSLWIKPDASTISAPLVSKMYYPDTGTQDRGWNIDITDSNNLTVVLRDTRTTQIAVTAFGAITLGAYQQVTVSYNGSGTAGGVKIYVNGAEQTANRFTASDTLGSSGMQNNAPIEIGTRDSGDHGYFQGVIDDVRIYTEEVVPGSSSSSQTGGGPLVRWNLEQMGSAIADDVIGNHDATVMDTSGWTTDAAPLSDSSVAFAFGQNKYLSVPHANGAPFDFSGSEPFTLSFWVKTGASGFQGGHVLSKRSASDEKGWGVYIDPGGNLSLNMLYDVIPANKGIGRTALGAVPIDDGFHHVVISYNGSGNADGIVMYVDAATPAFTVSNFDASLNGNDLGNTVALNIGTTYDGTTNEFFGATLDDIRIYDTALTFDQVPGGLSSSSVSGITPVARWSLDENTGTSATDSIGGHNASLIGSVAWTTDVPSGLPGSAAALDFSNGYLSMPHAGEYDFSRTDPFSLSFWVKPSASTWSAPLLNKLPPYPVSSSQNKGWSVGINDGSNLDVIIRDTNTTQIIVTAFGAMTLDTFQHVVISYDGSGTANGVKIYINGVEQTTNRFTASDTLGATGIQNTAAIEAGTLDSGDLGYLDGILDDIRIYDRVVTPTQIQ